MGKVGEIVGAQVGELAGSYLGNRLGGSKGKKAGGEIGKTLGGLGGSYLPFKKGGIVKPPRGRKTQMALLHKGELVVPASMVSKVPKTIKNKIAEKGGRNMRK